jgi:hypothetical protein
MEVGILFQSAWGVFFTPRKKTRRFSLDAVAVVQWAVKKMSPGSSVINWSTWAWRALKKKLPKPYSVHLFLRFSMEWVSSQDDAWRR